MFMSHRASNNSHTCLLGIFLTEIKRDIIISTQLLALEPCFEMCHYFHQILVTVTVCLLRSPKFHRV